MSERKSFGSSMPSLERDCTQNDAILTQILREHYRKATGPLIEDRVDLLEPAVALQYLESLTGYLGGRTKEQFLATHAAFHFAVNVASLLNWQVRELGGALPRLDEIPDDSTLSDARAYIVDTAKGYLQSRPRLDRIYAQYSARIDPSETFLFEAEAVYALTLRQIEFSGVQNYMHQTGESLSDADE